MLRSLRAVLASTFTMMMVAGVALLVAGPAAAASPAAGWRIESLATPTDFSASQNAACEASFQACDTYTIAATNAGAIATDGGEITVTDVVPAGLIVREAFLVGHGPCEVTGQLVRCTVAPGELLSPDQKLHLLVRVSVEPGLEGSVSNTVAVSGGAPAAESDEQNVISSAVPLFGFHAFSDYLAGADGAPEVQAGAHPYEQTTTIVPNTTVRIPPDGHQLVPTSVHDIRDVVVDLPPGLAGSALSAPTCPLVELPEEGLSGCPADTIVGHIEAGPADGSHPVDGASGPIWNITPERGVAAEFGFQDTLQASHVLRVSIAPGPEGYALRSTSTEIPQVALERVEVAVFGDPAERDGASGAHVPTFTNPASCDGRPLLTHIHMDSWQQPGARNPDGSPDFSDPNWVSGVAASEPVTGCNLLQFHPAISVQPETGLADAPTGLDVSVKVPQASGVSTLGTPPLRNTVLSLSEGLSIDPSGANGLAGCSLGELGMSASGEPDSAPPACPDASKIGTVELETPALRGTLQGEIYLARQNENPFGSLLAIYIVIDDPVTGVIVKLAGEVKSDPRTGQLQAIVDNSPQFPFSELRAHFFGGSRAALATPESCGTFTTTSSLTPWSAPQSGPPATPSSSFQINTGCAAGFTPAFSAGTTGSQAGGYSPFTLSFSRQDSEQEISGLTVSLPPGLVGKITGIEECSEQALAAAASRASGAAEQASPSCPAGSQIGTVQAAAGAGSAPFFLTGKAYLTGPYKGGPYGVAVLVPALAGPFDLGNVLVRSSLQIDPLDAHVTLISDAFPTVVQAKGADGQTDGFPIRLRRIDVSVNREHFTVNPTNCSTMAINATLASTHGAQAPVSSRFQAGGCASLKFDPKFTVETSSRTSKRGGASLTATLSYPNTPQGSEANLATARFTLPKALPSRLSTLQKACLARTFEANPASCPAGSIVGHATVTVPLLPLPLSGPAYFVSHGGEAFPSLTMVLQGNNVTVILTGSTFISKTGITSTTFKAIPDVPFNRFTLTLPQGPGSALAANGNLCTKKLTMPTQFHAQNGAQHDQTTPIHVTHCTQRHTKKHRVTRHHPKH